MPEDHLSQEAIVAHLSSPRRQLGVLAFHGRNAGPESMEQLIEELGWKDQSYALPRAANKTWYPERFMAPLEKNQEQLELALAAANKHHQVLRDAGLSDEQIVIMGFSQGACLAAHYALSNPAKYKAIGILTGGYVGHEGIDWQFNGDFEQTPVFISTSEIDEWVPPGRAAETKEAFERLNAQVTFHLFKDRPHIIADAEKEALRSLVALG